MGMLSLIWLVPGGCRSVGVGWGDVVRVEEGPMQPVTRSQVLSLAEAYTRYEWVPGSANVMHGKDPDGIRVDTPDRSLRRGGEAVGWWVVGRRNIGVPYQWGGSSTLEDFRRGLMAGKAAGDGYSETKRAGLWSEVSQHAVGVDCGGYVSRCWRLDRHYSTRELGEISDELPSVASLLPGDILNRPNDHCMIFVRWTGEVGGKAVFYEAAAEPVGRAWAMEEDVGKLTRLGFRPLRYRGIRGG